MTSQHLNSQIIFLTVVCRGPAWQPAPAEKSSYSKPVRLDRKFCVGADRRVRPHRNASLSWMTPARRISNCLCRGGLPLCPPVGTDLILVNESLVLSQPHNPLTASKFFSSWMISLYKASMELLGTSSAALTLGVSGFAWDSRGAIPFLSSDARSR